MYAYNILYIIFYILHTCIYFMCVCMHTSICLCMSAHISNFLVIYRIYSAFLICLVVLSIHTSYEILPIFP